MKKFIKELVIKKELKRFRQFKNNYIFEQKDIAYKDGSLFCDGICIKENEDADWIGETETFVNVGYKIHGSLPKVLSNLFPYSFYFKGYKYASAEGFFQALKFKDKKCQKLIFKMSGLDSNNIKCAQDYDWKEKYTVYFLGRQYDRMSVAYDNLIDELYVALLQNPLYVNALKKVGDKYILHAIGETEKTETVFTRYEFEKELNCLKDYCLKYK